MYKLVFHKVTNAFLYQTRHRSVFSTLPCYIPSSPCSTSLTPSPIPRSPCRWGEPPSPLFRLCCCEFNWMWGRTYASSGMLPCSANLLLALALITGTCGGGGGAAPFKNAPSNCKLSAPRGRWRKNVWFLNSNVNVNFVYSLYDDNYFKDFDPRVK